MQGVWRAGRQLAWLREDRPPTERERSRALWLPARLLAMQAALWAVGAALFFVLNVTQSVGLAFEVAITVALGGIASASVSYLLSIRVSRPIVARALEDAPPRRYRVPGVIARALMTWGLVTTVPVTGSVLLAAVALGSDVGEDPLARSTLALGVIALGVGLIAMLLLARSIADPLKALRKALGEVEAGQLDVRVPVNDATELGFVQAGFNRMVAGLRERERLRDLFGRHVGQDVAQRALEEGVRLGGEEREAAALFVDIIGSTSFAAEHRPTEVVDVLNRFFTIVVEVTREHGGLVNKFEGDAALCIFGAPLAVDDPADAALAAARRLRERIDSELPGVDAGIGVSCGTVVAGNVGAEDRFEYTVIGDPVNEAARLTELAKERPGHVVASEAALRRAGEAERARWRLEDEVVLRGRREPTRVALPAA